MSRRIWEINTECGFVCCVGYTKKQAVELILRKIMLEQENAKKEQEQKKNSRKRILIRNN